ncbi:MAG: hypothetical protein OJF51_001068 [Nitrospira sp.]|nr:MAG: hypothetical protein OJF51_001068 [Nitrospira sp.]
MRRQAQHERKTPAYPLIAPFVLGLLQDEGGFSRKRFNRLRHPSAWGFT